MDDLLPVGSVVELNDGVRMTIIGFFPSKALDEEFYDYICCRENRGIHQPKNKLKKNSNYFYIKQEDIKIVRFIGYSDFLFDKYKILAVPLIKKYKEERKKGILNKNDTYNILVNVVKDIKKEYGVE